MRYVGIEYMLIFLPDTLKRFSHTTKETVNKFSRINKNASEEKYSVSNFLKGEKVVERGERYEQMGGCRSLSNV